MFIPPLNYRNPNSDTCYLTLLQNEWTNKKINEWNELLNGHGEMSYVAMIKQQTLLCCIHLIEVVGNSGLVIGISLIIQECNVGFWFKDPLYRPIAKHKQIMVACPKTPCVPFSSYPGSAPDISSVCLTAMHWKPTTGWVWYGLISCGQN